MMRPFLVIALLGVTSCVEAPTPPVSADPLQISIAGGDDQVAAPGGTLPADILVKVTKLGGEPAPGHPVRFIITSGGGTLREEEAISNAEGVAGTRWTLGVSEGEQTMEARTKATGSEEVVSVRFRAKAVRDTTSTPPAVASVVLSPASATVSVGATVQLSATTKDANGNVLSGRTLTWASSNTSIAKVNSQGLVGGVSAGSATITATSEGISGTASVAVQDTTSTPPAVASVVLSPASATVSVGATVQLSATTKDANGNVLSGRAVTWASSNTSIATINSQGLVSGVSAGSATITATSEGISGTASVNVTPPSSSSYNEPTGFTKLTDRPFDSKAKTSTDRADPETCIGGSECWQVAEYRSAWTIVKQADAPGPGDNVALQRYPAGMAGGTAPQGEAYKMWDINAGYRSVYHRFWMKVSENWQGHLTGTNKIFHIWAEPKNIVFYSTHGTGSNPLRFAVNLQGVPEPDTDAYRYNLPNVPGQERTQIVRGKWHLFEVLLTLNTPGQKNGVIRVWQDGVQTHDYVGRELLAPTVAKPFWWEVQWSPTWGGLGDTVAQDMFLWIDQVYISGGK